MIFSNKEIIDGYAKRYHRNEQKSDSFCRVKNHIIGSFPIEGVFFSQTQKINV